MIQIQLTHPRPKTPTPTKPKQKRNKAAPSSPIILTPTKFIGPPLKPPGYIAASQNTEPSDTQVAVSQSSEQSESGTKQPGVAVAASRKNEPSDTEQASIAASKPFEPDTEQPDDTVSQNTEPRTNHDDANMISASLAAKIAELQDAATNLDMSLMAESVGPCTFVPCLLPKGVIEQCADCEAPSHRICYANYLGRDDDVGRLLCASCGLSKGGGNVSDANAAAASTNTTLHASSNAASSMPLGTPPHLVQVGFRTRHFTEVHSTMIDVAGNTGMKASQLAYHAKTYFKPAEADPEFGYTTVRSQVSSVTVVYHSLSCKCPKSSNV